MSLTSFFGGSSSCTILSSIAILMYTTCEKMMSSRNKSNLPGRHLMHISHHKHKWRNCAIRAKNVNKGPESKAKILYEDVSTKGNSTYVCSLLPLPYVHQKPNKFFEKIWKEENLLSVFVLSNLCYYQANKPNHQLFALTTKYKCLRKIRSETLISIHAYRLYLDLVKCIRYVNELKRKKKST